MEPEVHYRVHVQPSTSPHPPILFLFRQKLVLIFLVFCARAVCPVQFILLDLIILVKLFSVQIIKLVMKFPPAS
jgi:hypothetical protein